MLRDQIKNIYFRFNFKSKLFYQVISILCASSLPFIFSLNGEFVFDDSEAILKNPDVFSDSWTDLFINDFWGTDIKNSYSHKSYRPLTVLTYRLNYYLNNLSFSALHYKVTNLIFHITCSFIVWNAFDTILIDNIGKRRRKWNNDGAFIATLIFAVHPIHTEAVCGIVGRADVLAGNAFFLAFIFYQKSMNVSKFSYLYLFYALSMGAVSMLFKENGITVLGFCICYELIMKFKYKPSTNKKQSSQIELVLDLNSVVRLLGTSVVILFCLYARWKVMGGTKPKFQAVDNPAAFSNSIFTKIFTYNYIYFLNLLLFIWPQWLCYDWSMGCIPLIESIIDYRLIFVVLMYYYGFQVFKAIFKQENKESTRRLMTVAVLLILIPFLPACNIFYTVGFVLAERVLYISTAGYCLFIAIGIRKLNALERGKRHKKTRALLCLLLVLLSLRTLVRAEHWRNEFKLFINGASVCPLNAKVHYNIAKSVDTTDKYWAMDEYNLAIRLNPTYYQAMNNLGNLLKAEKRYKEAENLFKTALHIKKDFPVAWMNLGIVLSTVNRYEESEVAYINALRYRKNYSECLYNLGNLYLQMNNSEKALQSWLQAIRSNTTFTLPWYNTLTLLYDTGQFHRAQSLIQKAIEALPNTANIYFSAGNIYGKANKFTEAEKHFKTAIKLLGDDVKAIHYGNLGVLYHRWKKHPLAAEMYRKALKIDPTYAAGRKYLDNIEKL